MGKCTTESSLPLSTAFLRKHGYLDLGYRWGGITWTHSSGSKSNISFGVNIKAEGKSYITLSYTLTNRSSGEKTDMKFDVALVTTPCHYGGVRYWFICPLYKNGNACQRRVGVLYSIGNYFGCRHCGNLCYAAQLEGGKFRVGVCIPDIEKAERDVKRYYYNGKPTRKYRRVMRLNEKFEMSFIGLAARLDKNFGRLAGLRK